MAFAIFFAITGIKLTAFTMENIEFNKWKNDTRMRAKERKEWYDFVKYEAYYLLK